MAGCSSNASRDPHDEMEWTSGNEDPNSRDTTINGHHYRSHYGLFYPIFMGRISPGGYQGASINQISNPGYSPTMRGGFGNTTRSGGVRSIGG